MFCSFSSNISNLFGAYHSKGVLFAWTILMFLMLKWNERKLVWWATQTLVNAIQARWVCSPFSPLFFFPTLLNVSYQLSNKLRVYKTENLHFAFFCALRQFCWSSLSLSSSISIVVIPFIWFCSHDFSFVAGVFVWMFSFFFLRFCALPRRWQIRILKVEPIYINSSCLLSPQPSEFHWAVMLYQISTEAGPTFYVKACVCTLYPFIFAMFITNVSALSLSLSFILSVSLLYSDLEHRIYWTHRSRSHIGCHYGDGKNTFWPFFIRIRDFNPVFFYS